MLIDEINTAQRLVRTDAYQMSIGEIVSMYENEEVIIDPEFQRLFRWDISQKSRLIESLLLGIPIPSIFVFENEGGSWELIDGLQRISTILEFMGKLRSPEKELLPPSLLEATTYLPSLHNCVWEQSEILANQDYEQAPLEKNFQLAIRRARIGVEILKRPSDDNTKFDLFQRLNAGGTQANAQELRNCIMLMVNKAFYRSVKAAADLADFQSVVALSEDQISKQKHMEYASRFLVHTLVPYDGKLDVEEFIDDGIVSLASGLDPAVASALIQETFGLLAKSNAGNSLRKFEGGSHSGRVSLVGLEGIAVGIAKNLTAIKALPNPVEFVREKSQSFWSMDEAPSFSSLGLRGTVRIQRTVPLGEQWFRP